MKHKHHEMHSMEMKNDEMDEHHHDAPVEDEEILDWKKKLLGSWIFAIPIAILMLSERIFGFEIVPAAYTAIIILILGFPVLFVFLQIFSHFP